MPQRTGLPGTTQITDIVTSALFYCRLLCIYVLAWDTVSYQQVAAGAIGGYVCRKLVYIGFSYAM